MQLRWRIAALVLALASLSRAEAFNRTQPPCPCFNAGYCLSTGKPDGSVYCHCNLNPRLGRTYRGASCQFLSEECGNNLFCINGGRCVSGGCDCPSGFSGQDCEVDDKAVAATPVTAPADQRAPCPCSHGGTCLLIPATGQHVCNCVAPWVGASCTVDSNAAVVDAPSPPPPPTPPPPPVFGPPCPCAHGGQCLVANNKPVCKCVSPWIGARCTVDSETVPGGAVGRAVVQVASGHHKEVPGWAIAVIVLGTLALIALAVILGVVIYRERSGRPWFSRPSGFAGLSGRNKGGGGGSGGGRFSDGTDPESPYLRGKFGTGTPSPAPKSAMSSYDSGERSYRLGAYGGGSSLGTPGGGGGGGGGGAAVPLAEQDAEKRRLEILVGEIANVINEKDDYEYFEGSYLPSEEDDATPQFQRYHEMGSLSPQRSSSATHSGRSVQMT